MQEHIAEVEAGEVISALILSLGQILADDSENVRVTLCPDEKQIWTIRLQVSPKDVGRIIGKQGRTARSLRVLLQAASMKHQRRYCLDIEPLPGS